MKTVKITLLLVDLPVIGTPSASGSSAACKQAGEAAEYESAEARKKFPGDKIGNKAHDALCGNGKINCAQRNALRALRQQNAYDHDHQVKFYEDEIGNGLNRGCLYGQIPTPDGGCRSETVPMNRY